MHIRKLLTSLVLISTVVLALPGPAQAGPEITFVLGTLIGDSLSDVLQVRPSNLSASFKNAAIYGGRIGWTAFPFAAEGSLTISPSGIVIGPLGSVGTRFTYAEAELQILILPGPVAPFLAAGVGIHHMKLDIGERPSSTTLGYIIGGGLKIAFGSVGIRADLRDHITPLDVSKLGDEFVTLLGIAENTRAHNVELSGGLTVRF